MLKKDRRLGGHGDHSKSDHKGSDHSKDAKKDDHKEDDYCMKYDKYADKCNADDKCYFYTAKDSDKDKTDDKKAGHGDKPGYGEYKRGTGCYSKKMLKKDRRLG